jgi:hypothetical protein
MIGKSHFIISEYNTFCWLFRGKMDPEDLEKKINEAKLKVY